MQKVHMLQQHGVQPVVVFDGGRFPMKAAEEGSRTRLLAAFGVCSVLIDYNSSIYHLTCELNLRFTDCRLHP